MLPENTQRHVPSCPIWQQIQILVGKWVPRCPTLPINGVLHSKIHHPQSMSGSSGSMGVQPRLLPAMAVRHSRLGSPGLAPRLVCQSFASRHFLNALFGSPLVTAPMPVNRVNIQSHRRSGSGWVIPVRPLSTPMLGLSPWVIQCPSTTTWWVSHIIMSPLGRSHNSTSVCPTTCPPPGLNVNNQSPHHHWVRGPLQ